MQILVNKKQFYLKLKKYLRTKETKYFFETGKYRNKSLH